MKARVKQEYFSRRHKLDDPNVGDDHCVVFSSILSVLPEMFRNRNSIRVDSNEIRPFVGRT